MELGIGWISFSKGMDSALSTILSTRGKELARRTNNNFQLTLMGTRLGKIRRGWVGATKVTPNNFQIYFDLQGAFSDKTSFMIMSEESVAELNTKLDKDVSFKNFRPTILIHGTPGPFVEDMFTYVRIGEGNGPIVKTSKPCSRCRLTTVNPDTGMFSENGEPLKTLTEYAQRVEA